jgi:hypothetical protein
LESSEQKSDGGKPRPILEDCSAEEQIKIIIIIIMRRRICHSASRSI